eukprot:CAMPEP_0202872000 /NCGR_PEP_ID=MMETSP1391-20130828/20158_1 /ASSEMBLY_ACC=CAM_ASM_000867 /TAXON_ID=1034604 /ORGANISM="Chlamydomonas leiostraca, Strain SAG 11-49" /LENGTH=39 /DNA_ID= /DNA_START= /DNA_END= /DNA_ORIENTATION=
MQQSSTCPVPLCLKSLRAECLFGQRGTSTTEFLVLWAQA